MPDFGRCVTHHICDCRADKMQSLEAVAKDARHMLRMAANIWAADASHGASTTGDASLCRAFSDQLGAEIEALRKALAALDAEGGK